MNEEQYPPGTQENYNSFSPRNPITGKGKELEFPEGAGGGKEPEYPEGPGGGKGYRGHTALRAVKASTLRREAPLREPGVPPNEYIDKLTMELLLNKSHYAKYLAKTDPKKHDEYKLFKSNLRKYAVDIIDITSAMIENPKNALSADIEETFDAYVKSLLRHFELKEIENPHDETTHNTKDEDMLFGEMNEEPTPSQSFWSGEQVVKRPGISDLSAFGRPKR